MSNPKPEQAAVLNLPDFPTVGKKIVILDVPGKTATLKVTYQPDAPIAETVVIEVDGEANAMGLKEVPWTPAKPGIATIEAVDAAGSTIVKVNRSVTFDGLPATGVGVFVLAAVVLIGGSTWAMRLLLGADD